MANKILSNEEIKDKILSLDIAKECYAYYYKILYDKYLQLLKCHQYPMRVSCLLFPHRSISC